MNTNQEIYPTLLGGGFTWGLSGSFHMKCAPGCGDFCVFGTPKKQIPHIAPRWGVSGNSLTAALAYRPVELIGSIIK